MGNFWELINKEQPVLVDFYADWCGPCKVMAPTLQEVAKELEGKVKVLKVDVDKNPGVARQFKIMGIPTLILFKNGKPVWRQSGALPKHVITQEVSAVI